MARICGIISSDPDSFWWHKSMDRVYSGTWHQPPSRREVWTDDYAGLGHVTIGAVNPEPQPLQLSHNNHASVFCGKLFGTEDCRKRLQKEHIDFQFPNNDAELFSRLFERKGVEALAELNGLYSAAYWDASKRQLWLVTDRYGFRLLYYHHSPSRGVLVFSSRLRAIVESGLYDCKVHWPSWSALLHFGHCLGDDTVYEGIHAVPPGIAIRFDNNCVHQERYWDINNINIDPAISRDEAIDSYIAHFRRAIRRRVVPNVPDKVVFLSAGFDSRRIAAELARQGSHFSTYTTRGFAPKDTDGSGARKCAASLNVKNTFVNLPAKRFLETYWLRAVELLDWQTDLHAWLLPLIDHLPDNAKINYDGVAGDIVVNGVRRDSCFYHDASLIDWQLRKPYEMAQRIVGRQVDISFLHPDIRRSLSYSDVLEAVVLELRKYGNSANMLTSFYLLNRTRRAIGLSPFGLILQKAESFCPYLDNDLLAFTMSIPLAIRMEHTLRKESFVRAYPECVSNPSDALRNTQGCHQSDIRYHAQRRLWFFKRLWNDALLNNWMFDSSHALARLPATVADILRPSHVPSMLTRTLCLFYAWLEHHRSIVTP